MTTLKFILDNPDLFRNIISIIRACRTQFKCETKTAEEVMKEIEKWKSKALTLTPACKQVFLFSKRIE